MSLGKSMQGRKQFVPPAVPITSMMDMFTIIVFFLLFSYSERPDEYDVEADLELPTSTSMIDYENALALYLSEGSIKLEEATIGAINGENVEGLDPQDVAKSSVAGAFRAKKLALEGAARDAQAENASLFGSDDESKELLDPSDPHVLLFCDKDVSFRVINQVIKAAGSAGFSNFQLAVMEQ